MKRGIITLSILCSGILMISPISNLSFAQDTDNKEVINGQAIIQNVEESSQQFNTQDENKEEANIIDGNKSEEIKENNNKEVVKSEELKQEEPKHENEKTEEKTEKVETNVEFVKELNKDQAKDLLETRNPELKFTYQGNENDFSLLKEKGLSGYVFLPNVDGDMGYFVDKNTSNVYYFHPSGYMDLMI